MAFINSNQTTMLYGTNALAAYLRTVSPSASVEMLDVTTLADTAKAFTPGLEDFTLSIDGLFDTTTSAGSIWANITNAINAGSIVATSVAPTGFAVGNSVWVLPARTINYEVSSAVADVVGFSMSFGAGSPANVGVSLSDLTTFTSSGNGATVDNSSATSNGAIAVLHCTASSGTTPSATFTIQHSTNGSTWTTLQAFTAITGTTSEVITITGTVNRYARVIHTVSGTTPSFTCQISLARL
jgi:hypothetical protein